MSDEKAKIGGVVLILAFVFVIGPCVYRGSEQTITITVDEKDRVAGQSRDDGAKYLVWSTQGECFEVSDTLSYMNCTASDRYGRLKPGKTYRCKVAGWRFGCASMYRNIVDAREVQK